MNLAFIEPDVALDWAILERAPAVLARLVADGEFLQRDCFRVRYNQAGVQAYSRIRTFLRRINQPLGRGHLPGAKRWLAEKVCRIAKLGSLAGCPSLLIGSKSGRAV